MTSASNGAGALSPCPFCGGPAEHYHRSNRGEPAVGWLQHEVDHWVGCSSDEGCGGHTCMHESEAEAVAAWNTRVPLAGVEAGEEGKARLPLPAASGAASGWMAKHGLPRRVAGAAETAQAALKDARQFIINGIELGFIRMPDPETPDPAHGTLGKIDAALAMLEGKANG